jgi:Ca2+-binding RTX toxin-like protein
MINRYDQVTFTNGTSADDIIVGHGWSDIINGLGGDDFLLGYAGRDNMMGGDGNDWLDGGSGNDDLFGEAGDDTLIGGTGQDVFHFTAGFIPGGNGTAIKNGFDIIQDFTPGVDKFDFVSVSNFTSFADVQANSYEDTNGNLVIKTGFGGIKLLHTDLANLHSSDFIFA